MLLPIIDVHVHAMTADGAGTGAHGDPPFAFNLPTREWPAHDPAKAWAGVFFRWHEDAGGESTVWSPKTDDELRDQTLEVMERRNIIGVLCGPPDLVAAWRAAAPHRFIPAVGMAVGWTELTPESIRRLHAEGKLAVLAEVTNQYAGVEPDDDRFEPSWRCVSSPDGPKQAGGIGLRGGPSLPPAPCCSVGPTRQRWRRCARGHSTREPSALRCRRPDSYHGLLRCSGRTTGSFACLVAHLRPPVTTIARLASA